MDDFSLRSTQLEQALFEMRKVVVGQDRVLERLMVGLLADGHCLLEGVPGLGKTITLRTMARVTGGSFNRIQFTPDLIPADIVGTRIYRASQERFDVEVGPVLANFVLADEVNRAPAKVQAAMLEVMGERQVTIGENTFKLEEPFLVLATQNPIEQEGTYPLPEAQVDRFMMKLRVGYPSRDEELEIMNRMSGGTEPTASPVIKPETILAARNLITEIYVDEKIKQYILDIVFATREPAEFGLDIGALIAYGGSPRASLYLSLAARAHAFLQGRAYVTPEDIKAIAMDVLRHRVIITYEAEAEELTSEDIVQRILDSIEVP